MANILIIDDDSEICELMAETAAYYGYTVTHYQTLKEGVRAAYEKPFDIVFLDNQMPDGSGLDVLAQIRGTISSPEVIMMTGHADAHGAEKAIKSGAWDYLKKPVVPQAFIKIIERILQHRKTRQDISIASDELKLEGIVGNSPAFRHCIDMVRLSAESDANVLIVGETGTGKELFAKAIHANSRHTDQSFVVLDCGALPASLVGSELFGYKKGAFTSAEKNKVGLVQSAHNGVLFLDEAGELPLEIQKAFLRVLQEHRFRPIGDTREIESNFRVIAATNRNLEEMCANGQFRTDLLYRLKGISVYLPPLRSRPEDIETLTNHYIKIGCSQYGISPIKVSEDVYHIFKNYPWPGNVRELINAVNRALAAGKNSSLLLPIHLPEYIRINVMKTELGPKTDRTIASVPSIDFNQFHEFPAFRDYRGKLVSDAENLYLRELLKRAEGSVEKACQISGLGRTRLYNLLKKHGLSKNQE